MSCGGNIRLSLPCLWKIKDEISPQHPSHRHSKGWVHTHSGSKIDDLAFSFHNHPSLDILLICTSTSRKDVAVMHLYIMRDASQICGCIFVSFDDCASRHGGANIDVLFLFVC